MFVPAIFVALAAEIGATHRFVEHLQRARIVAQASDRSRSCRPARSAFIARSVDRIHAERFGDAIHVDFDGELRLRRAESAKRAVRRRVREHRAAVDASILTAIRTGRVNAAARQHHRDSA